MCCVYRSEIFIPTLRGRGGRTSRSRQEQNSRRLEKQREEYIEYEREEKALVLVDSYAELVLCSFALTSLSQPSGAGGEDIKVSTATLNRKVE